MAKYAYDIEATFENVSDDGGRVDTIVVTMEHLDFFIAVNRLIDEHYPARLVELHCTLIEDDDDDD